MTSCAIAQRLARPTADIRPDVERRQGLVSLRRLATDHPRRESRRRRQGRTRGDRRPLLGLLPCGDAPRRSRIDAMDSPVLVFELCFQEFSPVQRNVLSGYCRAFASRHLFIKPVAEPGAGPYLFSDGTPLAEKTPHCYWNWGSNSDIEPEADGCAWI